MAHILVHHKVEDYNKWKPVYDGHENTRKNSGSKGSRLYRSKDNPNELVILFDWDTLENAHKFASSQELKEAMQKAGVIGMPEIFFLDEIQKSNA